MLVGLVLALILIMVVIGVVVVAHLAFASRNEVPAVFTPARVMDEVLEALDLPERGLLVDLGCGDGRILAGALKRRPGLSAVGVDNNPVVLGLARIRLRRGAKLILGEVAKMRFGEVNRVFAYLGPGLMAQLEPRLLWELPKDARLVSLQFPLPHRQPDNVIELKAGESHAVRLYVYDY